MSSKITKNNGIFYTFGTLALVIIAIIPVVLTSGCVNNDNTKNYSGNGISFNYPANWTVTFPDNSGTQTTFSIIGFRDSMMEGPQFQVNIMPSTESTQDVINNGQSFLIPGGTIISNGTLKIDGETAYQTTYTYNDNSPNGLSRYEQIGFVKNGKIYSFLFKAPDSDFDNEKPNFEMILNSFKVQSSFFIF